VRCGGAHVVPRSSLYTHTVRGILGVHSPMYIAHVPVRFQTRSPHNAMK